MAGEKQTIEVDLNPDHITLIGELKDTYNIASEGKVLRIIMDYLQENTDVHEDYYLLGPIEFELDLYPMIATYHSPFGQAMVGKKVNENFFLDINGEKIKFTIISIEKITAK